MVTWKHPNMKQKNILWKPRWKAASEDVIQLLEKMLKVFNWHYLQLVCYIQLHFINQMVTMDLSFILLRHEIDTKTPIKGTKELWYHGNIICGQSICLQKVIRLKFYFSLCQPWLKTSKLTLIPHSLFSPSNNFIFILKRQIHKSGVS